jgi:hypothetical protein
MIFTLLPYFVTESAAIAMLTALVGFYLSFEVAMLLIIRTKISLNVISPYLLAKILSGLIKKASVLSLGLIGGFAA